MAITTLDGLIAAAVQRLPYLKTTTRTSVAAMPFSMFDVTGNPGAGTLAIGDTSAGVVPTAATAGYPPINSFAGGAKGYLSNVQFSNSVASRIGIYDCVWSAGAFAYNASATLASQPSYSGRMPNGTDYKGTEIWLETVTTFTGLQSVAITYTNQDGVTGRTTGTVQVAAAAPIVGRMFCMPLQAGDTGVQKIESITSTVATAGTFNVHVMRRLWSGRVKLANDGDVHDFLKTGLPEIFATSALRFVFTADSTSTGTPELLVEIASG